MYLYVMIRCCSLNVCVYCLLLCLFVLIVVVGVLHSLCQILKTKQKENKSVTVGFFLDVFACVSYYVIF
jgi:hypothetical protein